MHRVLGLPKEDTVPDPLTSGVQSNCSIDTEPYRYIDIELGQIPQFKPFARIYISGDSTRNEFKRPQDTPEHIRLLTDPLRRLDKLNIKLKLQDDKAPNHEIITGHDLSFEVLSLEPTNVLPDWVDQRLFL